MFGKSYNHFSPLSGDKGLTATPDVDRRLLLVFFDFSYSGVFSGASISFCGGFGITTFMTSVMWAFGMATLKTAFPFPIFPPKAMLFLLSTVFLPLWQFKI